MALSFHIEKTIFSFHFYHSTENSKLVIINYVVDTIDALKSITCRWTLFTYKLKENTRSLDIYQRKVVDIGVKYSKDVVKSRKNKSKLPSPVYLMVHGGAGAGKSTVINILAQWVQKILQKEGKIAKYSMN